MVLIADSGSTKADWRIINKEGKIEQFVTKGINPYYQSRAEIELILSQELFIEDEVSEIHFYGAGCSSIENKSLIEQVLLSKFSKANIWVEDDMLASARALSGRDPGIVCILGTGSNACFYDGENIIGRVPSLGYVLGDEGSGNWLGRQLISDYFGNKLTSEDRQLFEQFGDTSVPTILDSVYMKQQPSAYMASYSKLIKEHIANPYFYELVLESFHHFIDVNVKYFNNYQDLSVHFTGSVAFVYSNILRQAAINKGINAGKIIQSPIAGLTLFHQNS